MINKPSTINSPTLQKYLIGTILLLLEICSCATFIKSYLLIANDIAIESLHSIQECCRFISYLLFLFSLDCQLLFNISSKIIHFFIDLLAWRSYILFGRVWLIWRRNIASNRPKIRVFYLSIFFNWQLFFIFVESDMRTRYRRIRIIFLQ